MNAATNRLEAIRHVFLLALSLVLLIPFYIALVNAFKTRADILSNPLSLPLGRFTLDNFSRSAITSSFNIFKAYQTSIFITVVSVILLIFICSMMSFVFARNKNKFLSVSYLILLSGLMIPPQVILIPLVQVLAKFGLMFTPQGLILYNIGFYVPFTVFIYVGHIRTISKELDESARMDGASHFTIFWRIIFPLLRPATASCVIFLSLWIWNDFINPLIILGSTKGYTVTTGIFRAVGQYSTNWEDIFALVVLASFPIFLLYLLMQKQFISGLTEGSVKG
ncbi:carbohydrate ABC transporter permease [Paenibacillus eucommiae]|uniref:Raffinose/stachyose/melibiose transport system permease protein n=1 Tax=Paenibacillus eucommiae TaxID=1355755 RepID=A0ABS4IM60_9BACL|nr:carbohydrate ABC transporter permease [Paenibacillus eucommiae]MBP1988662.1 raffinose/stachyose/melibiose transport system permease protein [Paenibacillus eucommiae]